MSPSGGPPTVPTTPGDEKVSLPGFRRRAEEVILHVAPQRVAPRPARLACQGQTSPEDRLDFFARIDGKQKLTRHGA
jgi:hypothetical protein